ncbi:MAG TPA: hypothetical protein DCQ34_10435 [Chitinophagaceae bacterium]|nr:hypothetical protein [Chitinophagaceae bacterium]HRF26753.1 thiol-disulfide oxidoreductase DCC family protein [Ferruginibacter sp.]
MKLPLQGMELMNKAVGHPVVLFDGVCNLCNRSVMYIIRHDPDAVFRFAALQSDIGRQALSKLNQGQEKMSSIVLLKGDKVFTHSTAALSIARQLKGPIRLAYAFIIVPRFIRDGVYNWIARNRYRWFGKKDQCMVPRPDLLNRFIS